MGRRGPKKKNAGIGRGGPRKGAGRKSKSEEQKLIEALSPMAKTAQKVLFECLEEREPWAVKMFFDYYYGKPVERQHVVLQELPPMIVQYAGADPTLHINGRSEDSEPNEEG